jgi:hypothetical protein
MLLWSLVANAMMYPNAEERATAHVRLWQILLRKSFWGGERKFLEPLMRFMRGNVRDHIVSSKIDHEPPQWR